ncbi:MAG: hypothetical protein DRQ89_12295, partial [Epsilonproteobacteria bacterium]
MKVWNLLISVIYLVTLGCGLPINIELPTVTKIYLNPDSLPQTELIIEGNHLSNVDAVSIRQSSGVRASANGTYPKDFKIIAKSNNKIVSQGINNFKLDGNMLLDLVLSRAEGQSIYPIEFIPGLDSIEAGMIQDKAVTRLKLAPEPTDSPVQDQVLKWDNVTKTFFFADDIGAGGGGGTVTQINRGRGIKDDGTPITTTGTIEVDYDTTGDSALLKIPYFNNSNQLVIDSDTTNNDTKLFFKSSNDISIHNDGSLAIIDENAMPPIDIMVLNPGGDVSIFKDLEVKGTSLIVDGQEVCQKDGTNCPTSSPDDISEITVTAPITGGGASGTVNIGIDPAGYVSSLTTTSPALTVAPTVGPVIVDVNFGSNALSSDLIQRWDYNLDDIALLTPLSNGVIIRATDTSKWEVEAGIPLTQRLGLEIDVDVQAWDTDLQTISDFPHSNGDYMVSDGMNWTLRQTPFCAFGQVVTANTGIDFTCTDNTFIFQLSETRWLDPAGAPGPNYVGFKAPPNIASSTMWQLPDADGAPGTLLMTDGSARLSWSANVGGDVTGPGVSLGNSPALFNGATGKLIKSPSYTFPDASGGAGQVLMNDGLGAATWQDTGTGDVNSPTLTPVVSDNLVSFDGTDGKLLKDSGIATADVGDIKVSTVFPVTDDDTVVLWDGNNSKIIKGSNLSYNGTLLTGPSFIESGAYILRNAALNQIIFNPPAGLVDYSLTYPGVGPLVDQILRSDASGNLSWADTPSAIGDVVGPGPTQLNRIALYADAFGTTLKETNYTIPDTVGITGQFLMSNGSTDVIWSDVSVGNVVGPTPGSTQFAIPTYADTTGELLLNSTLIYNGGVLSGPTNINSPTFGLTTATNQLNLSVNPSIGTNYNLIFPAVAPSPDEILVSDGSGNFDWQPLPLGTGDVIGPVLSVQNGAAIYSDTTGKNIVSTTYALPPGNGALGQALVYSSPSTVTWIDVGNVRGPLTNADNTIPLWNGADSKTLKDSNLNYTPLGVLSGPTDIESLEFSLKGSTSGTLNLVAQSTFPDYTLTFPGAIPGTNQILRSDVNGNLSWADTPLVIGDVTGPAASIDLNLAMFDGTTGKIISDSAISSNDIVTSGATGALNQNAMAIFGDANGRVVNATPYTFPTGTGVDQQILRLNASNQLVWDSAGTGDVVGPLLPVIDSNLAAFDTTTGKLIKDSGIATADVGNVKVAYPIPPAPPTNDNTIVLWDGNNSKTIKGSNISYDGTTLDGPVNMDANAFRIKGNVSGVISLLAPLTVGIDYNIIFPLVDGAAGEILQSDGAGQLSWIPTPAGGDVTGPGASGDLTLAMFDGTTGKIIADSTISSNKIVQSGIPVTGYQDTMAIFGDDAGKIVNPTPYTFPTVTGVDQQILRLNAANQLVWDSAGTGDVSSTGPFVLNG